MPRFRFLPFIEVCVTIAVLSGCGDGNVADVATSEAVAIPTGTAPVAEPAVVTTLEDQALHATLHASDAEGDALTFSITDAPEHATVSLDPATGAYELQPIPNYFGADAFEFTASDGHGGAARARVDVTVEPVRDPPVIDTSATAQVIAAGKDAELRFAISDSDGDAVTVSVAQVGGTLPLSNLQVVDHEVRFHAPEVGAATTVELTLDAVDATGLVAHARQVITLSPVSLSGKLFTVLGSPQSDGLHWVITGDGFTADQQQELLRASLAMARAITAPPELARHSAIWNVHVLTAASSESGVATAGGSRAPRTAFDGTLDCTDVERVACVNWDKVYAALLAEDAPFDEVAVVLNTGIYVGNSSSSGLIVSRNTYAPAIALHEMGHVVAGLGDEYVDKAVVNAFAPRYREGQFPNVTTATDPARIPWRHWFTDPAHIPVAPGEAGVGRFEGAFYSASGFYRPKQDSNMRTLAGAVGEVNGEAWLRALYRAVPPVRATYPEQRTVAGSAGDTLAFEVVSAWSPELMAVRWFVDGVEIEQARGTYRYLLHADGGPHEVRASMEDCTGRIRAPDAREQMSSVAWSVANGAETGLFKAQPRVPRIGRWLRMRVDSSGHSVMGSSSSEPRFAKALRTSDDSGFEYTLYDAGGATLADGRLLDPRVIHGPLAPPGAAEAGHATRTLQSGYYLIGIPEGVDARRLRIRARDGSIEKAAQAEQWLDL
ncbi:MAG TPA: M64 family metallopeptidase [Steroidobacteraceae bacterium]|jgi:hypothetical protein|nr:M64 family metallopeptidase [Steroidobacteraceae bacterium]